MVGVGMLGASAARHLADAGVDVVLVGQAEPADRRTHDGVFASHHDVARVSRTVDPDPVRAWLGDRSVPQFAEVAARTGITAVNPVGHLWVESAPGLDLVAASGERFGRDCVRRDLAATHEAFPYLFFGDLLGDLLGGGLGAGGHAGGLESLWEPPPAGSVDPRAHVRAETAAAVAAGAAHLQGLVDSVVPGTDGVEVMVSSEGGGQVISADRVLLATGAFSGHGDTPAAGLDLEYALHTQLLVHLDAEEADRLAGMPSIIGKYGPFPGEGQRDDFYLTPPVPDTRPHDSGTGAPGDRWILKIGSPQDDHVRVGADELAAWFRTDGDPAFAANLARILDRLLPDLRDVGRWTTSCVTTYTPSGHPFIDWLDGGDRPDGGAGRVACAIGGNGYAAKCAPALGELAAGMLLGGTSDRAWPTEVDRDLFRTRWLA